jgi:uncharacterized membrane protein (Fun14 family)
MTDRFLQAGIGYLQTVRISGDTALPQNNRSKRNIMSSELLLTNVIPFAGSGLVGYAIGFAFKKILKLMLIIIGFLVGMFFLAVQLMQKYGYLSTVNWNKLGNDTSTQM